MRRHPPAPLATVAERRAEAPARTPDRGGEGVRPPGAGLSLRERRVKAILLKELERTTLGIGLSYNERQKIAKTLDVAFIDAELAEMRRQLRYLPRTVFGTSLALGLFLAVTVWQHYAAGRVGAAFVLVGLLPLVVVFLNPVLQHRALRRKIFIYEALRELSDADEFDVTLNDTVRQADLLIDRIVERELAADAMYAAARTPRRN